MKVSRVVVVAVFDFLFAGFNAAVGFYWSRHPWFNYATAIFLAGVGVFGLVCYRRRFTGRREQDASR
jgi:hypothetical protein